MKKVFAAAIIFNFTFLVFNCAFGQPTFRWQKCFGGSGYDTPFSVYPCTDNGFVIIGKSNSNDGDVSVNYGNSDYWVVKTDALGNLQWQKNYGGSNSDVGHSIEQTSDGGYIISGTTQSNDSDITANHGGYEIWILKTNPYGVIQWQRTFGGSGDDFDVKIKQTADGGFIVGGNSYSIDGDVTGNHGGGDYWVVKLDSMGTIRWQKSYGGSEFDQLTDIKNTLDRGYIICGTSYSTDGDVTGNTTGNCSWILKTDSVGTILWQQNFPAGGIDSSISVGGIVSANNGNYIVAGRMYNLGYKFYFATALLDSLGNVLEKKRYLTNTYWESCRAINASPQNGGYVLSGGIGWDYTGNYMMKVNDGLNTEWLITYGGSGTYSEIKESTDGGFIMLYSQDDTIVTCSPTPKTDYRLIKLGGTVNISEEDKTFLNLTAHLSPANTLSLTFSSPQSTNLHLTLTDITGRTLLTSNFKPETLNNSSGINKKEIQVGDLAKGIYIVTLCGEEGSESVKVVKE